MTLWIFNALIILLAATLTVSVIVAVVQLVLSFQPEISDRRGSFVFNVSVIIVIAFVLIVVALACTSGYVNTPL